MVVAFMVGKLHIGHCTSCNTRAWHDPVRHLSVILGYPGMCLGSEVACVSDEGIVDYRDAS